MIYRINWIISGLSRRKSGNIIAYGFEI